MPFTPHLSRERNAPPTALAVAATLCLAGCAAYSPTARPHPIATRQAAPSPAPQATTPPVEGVAHRAAPAGPWSQRAPESPNVSQLTFASVGEVFDPSISRDGQWLAFAGTQHRTSADIYIKRIESRVVTQLTNDPAEDTMPAISPDGARIAFASNRNGNWDIYVMPISGGRPMQITSDAAHEVHPSWSPDGTRLVYNRMGLSSGRWEMWVTEVHDSPVSHFIGYGMFPQWCPKPGTGLSGGDRILFQRSRERGDRAFSIWTLDFKGDQASAPTEIISSPVGALINPSWSPDGKRITFASVPNEGDWSTLVRRKPRRADLWMLDIEGTNLIKLTDGATVDLSPVWAGSSRIVFASNRNGEDNLWALDVTDAIRLAEGRSTPGLAAAQEETSSGR
ncbi:MAG: PD40 domain-containing protein [Phycisphaeraceae bacterium]|nr:PD40 domain-containing protein [Phycisphaeraceae bacterium]